MNGNIIRSKDNPNCYRRDENGWIFVHVEGPAAVRGFNFGFLLADEIIRAVTDAKTLIEIQTGVPWDFFLYNESSIIHNWKKRLSEPNYYEFSIELINIVAGVKAARRESPVSVDDIILWNGYEELTDYWFPTVASNYNDVR